ncbi:SGNH/GDSL hydrolase family protein [Kineosporia sp. J2-2]|uniref:SGNH/GDSL hydrolase family protein n=1 Tax=Kineosporia corallincola TaxID=2835133 RepID=A0ABS5TQ77_9ACTN|nr:SGNH/GDSL hydrolase family protein [Kineosporia corallincola]MBT0773255.1 SGNH/GDSL hydrolase family protein [Kineosporia corallincola]
MCVAAVVAFFGVVVMQAGPASAGSRSWEYVALGDSYAAGVGAPPYDPAGGDCLRSPLNYAHVWAAEHPRVTLTDVTCSGAATDDVEAEQLSALSRRTKLVTLTIGGNDDSGFSRTLNACLGGTDAQCEAATQAGADYATNVLAGDLEALYTEVKQLAPRARVVVLNYPQLIDQGTGSCGAITPSSYRRGLIAGQIAALDAAISTATSQARVKLVDVRPDFVGHEACSADPWILGTNVASQTEWFHPNPAGHAAYGAALEAAIG